MSRSFDRNDIDTVPAANARPMCSFVQVAGPLFTENQGGSDNLAGEWKLVEDAGWAKLCMEFYLVIFLM